MLDYMTFETHVITDDSLDIEILAHLANSLLNWLRCNKLNIQFGLSYNALKI